MADAAGEEVGPASGRDYALQRSAAERRRLVLQEHVIGPSTARFFDDAGLRPGMRVLDVGSGAGDVAMLVARTVGPTGSVVGVDIDDASAETARQRAAAAALANVEFVTADVASADLGSGFDAVVGRLVLMHVPDPVLVLRRVVSAHGLADSSRSRSRTSNRRGCPIRSQRRSNASNELVPSPCRADNPSTPTWGWPCGRRLCAQGSTSPRSAPISWWEVRTVGRATSSSRRP